jgi:hypothetical protein
MHGASPIDVPGVSIDKQQQLQQPQQQQAGATFYTDQSDELQLESLLREYLEIGEKGESSNRLHYFLDFLEKTDDKKMLWKIRFWMAIERLR